MDLVFFVVGILWFEYFIYECVFMWVYILNFSVKVLFEDVFVGSI